MEFKHVYCYACCLFRYLNFLLPSQKNMAQLVASIVSSLEMNVTISTVNTCAYLWRNADLVIFSKGMSDHSTEHSRQGPTWDWAAYLWSWRAWVGDRPHSRVYLGPPVPLRYTVVGVGAGDLDHCAAISFSRLACMTSSACC